HQMIDVGPVPLFEKTVGEIEYPIVRDVDTNMYERQHGSEFEIGSYAHRPILIEPDGIPSIEQAAQSPTELPFTKDDFDPQMEAALELFPDIVGDERVGVKYAVNGLISLTPDGMPIVGETPEVRGLWSVAAIWVKEGPGFGRTVAEWMTDGCPEIDPHASDAARFHDHQRTKRHILARSAEGYNKTYGIVHPMEQWESNRDVRLSPFNGRERDLGAVFYETAGWERPFWYGSNEGLLDEYGDRVMPREAEWEARWWSPIINAEHLAMRDRVAMVELSAFAILDIAGPAGRPAVGVVHARAVGAEGPGRAWGRDRRRRLARWVPLRHLPVDRGGHAERARVTHLVRWRARLGAVRADGARGAALGRAVGGRKAPRRGPGGDRRLRHDGPP